MRLLKPFFLLLFSFQISFVSSQEDIKSTIIEPFQKDALYREKVFIHTNKTTYFVNENIWFTAYVGKDADNSPSEYTSNLEVRLLNSKGEVLKEKTLFIKEGVGVGDFLLEEKLISDTYYIESSTNFMKNFGKDNVYLQEIEIINPSKKRVVEKGENKYDLQVFPESGYLLEEAENTIGLKALINGKGFVYTGKIEDSKGATVTSFKGNLFGMSRCSFYYHQNEVYTAIVTINGTTQRVSLPKAQKTGVIFNVDNTDEEQVKLTLRTNKKTLPTLKTTNFAIIFYRNNHISEAVTLSLKNDTQISQNLFFDKSKLLNGVNIVTLFKNNQPIAERKFFVNKLEEQTALLVEKLDKVNDSIIYKIKTLGPNYNSISAKLSVSTLPIDSKVFKETQNIKSSFLLSTYVKGAIENPSFYFSNTNEREQEFLDLLLLNQGWSTYTLQEKIEEINPKKEFDFESGFTLNGTVKKFPKGYDIAILSKQNRLTTTSKFNKTNKFSFKNIFAYKNDSAKVAFIKKDKPLVKPNRAAFINNKKEAVNHNYLVTNYDSQPIFEQIIEDSKTVDINSLEIYPDTERLDVVELNDVRKKRKETIYDKEANIAVKRKVIAAGFYQGKKVTEQMEETYRTIWEYFQSLGIAKRSGLGRYFISLSRGVTSLLVAADSRNPDGTWPPAIYLDGVDFFKGSDDIAFLQNISMRDVDEILINRSGAGGGATGTGGIIKIYLKKGNHQYYDQPTKKLYENLVLLTGFDRANEYYKPLYNIYSKNTLNWTEIDWKNSLQTDNNGEIIIKVPTNKFSNDNQLIINGFSKEGLLFHYIYTN
ncbi:MAG: hypothetical protein COA67_04790 [Lutibacter sp.]|nr:MAG: hypothetical protein COA67_04790 [Lutibacter sp.]